MLTTMQYALGGLSGVIVGFVLGLVGGGGSLLAVPLLLYLVGIKDPHQAVGTSAFAVAVNAATGLIGHAATGTVNWRSGAVYAGAGVIGALGRSTLGKAVDGHKLLFLFALLMIAVAVLMFVGRRDAGEHGGTCDRGNLGKVVGFGFCTGVLSGFFGIGGEFLIVPGLMASTRMPILRAVGTSLITVTAFGLTTALNYALSGFILWPVAGVFVACGICGSLAGSRACRALAGQKGRLNTVFACFVMVVAIITLVRSWATIAQ